MALPPPATLSPSKVSAFRDCALAFRYTVIEQRPELPSLPAVRGTLVHLALQELYRLPAPERRPDQVPRCVQRAHQRILADDEFVALDLDPAAEADLVAEASHLAMGIFDVEDPTTVTAIGLELQLTAPVDDSSDPITMRGIIDRLDRTEDGHLVITDYKSGRSPTVAHEQSRLGGVQVYALLCERMLGRRPALVRLVYLADRVAIEHVPTDQSMVAVQRRLRAIWEAMVTACATEEFWPRPSGLCHFCAHRPICPAWAEPVGLAPGSDVPRASQLGRAV